MRAGCGLGKEEIRVSVMSKGSEGGEIKAKESMKGDGPK
jgi:hypothetical protein